MKMKDERKTKAQLINELNELRLLKKNLTEPTEIEEALRQSQERFWVVWEIAADAMALSDANGIVLAANPAYFKLYGYPPEAVIGQSFALLFPENKRDWALAGYKAAFAGESSRLKFDAVIQRADGLECTVEAHIGFINANGQRIAMLSIIRDISERKQAEEDLRKSEQRLELALQGADLGLWDIHLPSGEEFVNQRAAEMLGYTLAELEPHLKWWDERTHPDDLPRLIALWDAHAAGQTPFYESEYRLRAKSGEWRWILDRGKVVAWDKEGQPVRATGTHLDITERKHSEETLQKLNRELALLNRASQAFNSSLELDMVLVSLLEEVRPLLGVIGASVWLIDPQNGDLVCRQASGAHRELLRGWRLAAGQGIVGWVAQYDQTQVISDVQSDPRHFKEVEQKLKLKLHSILSVPLRSKEKVIGVLEVVDTEAHRFSQSDQMLVESLAATATIAIENARLYEQTRRDAETKAVLLQEVNHRTKNNLAAIIGLLHLEQRHLSDETRAIYRTMMQDLISRIHGLATVHRLLSTSEWSPVSLSELVTRVIHSALQALPLDKAVAVDVPQVSIKIAPKLANTIALVINELTTNTVKYAFLGREQGCISVQIGLEKEQILLEFRDDGPGFPADVLSLAQHHVGWELIQTLVEQGLQGQVRLHNDYGAVTNISFPQVV